MQPYNLSKVYLSVVLYRICSLDRQKARRLSHPINYHPNGVMLSASTRYPCDDIHIDHIPLPSRSINILSHTSWFQMFYLDLLTIGALIHKVCYIPLHDIPPVYYLHIAVHLSGTWMNRIPRVMGFCKNMLPQLAYIRNTQSTLVAEYTISPLGENLHSLIVNCTLKLKQNWITVFLFLNLHYQKRIYPILNCYTIV